MPSFLARSLSSIDAANTASLREVNTAASGLSIPNAFANTRAYTSNRPCLLTLWRCAWLPERLPDHPSDFARSTSARNSPSSASAAFESSSFGLPENQDNADVMVSMVTLPNPLSTSSMRNDTSPVDGSLTVASSTGTAGAAFATSLASCWRASPGSDMR